MVIFESKSRDEVFLEFSALLIYFFLEMRVVGTGGDPN